MKDPCQGMTVADCKIGEDNIVEQLPYNAAECEMSCKMSDNCHFWRVYQDDGMDRPECLHLSTNYHKVRRAGWKGTPVQDCASFAGPIDGDIESCLNTDQNTCSAYIEEECQYNGGELGNDA